MPLVGQRYMETQSCTCVLTRGRDGDGELAAEPPAQVPLQSEGQQGGCSGERHCPWVLARQAQAGVHQDGEGIGEDVHKPAGHERNTCHTTVYRAVGLGLSLYHVLLIPTSVLTGAAHGTLNARP